MAKVKCYTSFDSLKSANSLVAKSKRARVHDNDELKKLIDLMRNAAVSNENKTSDRSSNR